MQGILDSLNNQVDTLKDEFINLDQRISKSEEKEGQQEQYSRRNSLRIINPWPEERLEDTDGMVVKMAKDFLNVDIRKQDIDRSHRVGPPNANRSLRPIIVKFLSYRVKDKIYKARDNLHQGGPRVRGIHINEDLTKARVQIRNFALQLKRVNLILDTWTRGGNTFVPDMASKINCFTNMKSLTRWGKALRDNPPPLYSEVVSP